MTEAVSDVSLHNVAETASPDWADAGVTLHRVPGAVRDGLNVGARERYRRPAGCELRFVPTGDEPVEVTLSAPDGTVVRPYWGPFQPTEPVEVGAEPTTLSLSVPERVGALRPDVPTGPFDPRVCRVRFEGWEPVAVHDVSGPRRPPTDGELPARRLLAYGTSITAGGLATTAHLSYVSQLARALGVDPLNLGASGSAYCEPAVGEYIAGREDWDLATLSVSVNMANRGFTVEQFRERVTALFDAVAGAHPDEPVVAVTLYPYHADLVAGDDADRAAAYRETVQTAVERSPHDNLHVVSGTDLLDPTGLTTDLLHPGDAGMTDVGRRLAAEIEGLLD